MTKHGLTAHHDLHLEPAVKQWTPDTQLRVVPDADLRLECSKCGHQATIPIFDLTRDLDRAATLGDLQARIRCQCCGESHPLIVIPTQASGDAEQNIAEEKRGRPHRPG